MEFRVLAFSNIHKVLLIHLKQLYFLCLTIEWPVKTSETNILLSMMVLCKILHCLDPLLIWHRHSVEQTLPAVCKSECCSR